MLEPQGTNWGVIGLKEVELADKLSRIDVVGDHVIVSEGEKSYYFKIDVKDTIDGPDF